MTKFIAKLTKLPVTKDTRQLQQLYGDEKLREFEISVNGLVIVTFLSQNLVSFGEPETIGYSTNKVRSIHLIVKPWPEHK